MSAASGGGQRRGGGSEEERGLGSQARAGLPATRLHVCELRSAPPATDKGWEDAAALGCWLRAACRLPELLYPPPVSDCKDRLISLGQSPHSFWFVVLGGLSVLQSTRLGTIVAWSAGSR